MLERKRTKAEERSHTALLGALADLELYELELWNRNRKLKEKMIPPEWQEVEKVPVRPAKTRVTAAYDADVVKFFRAMGQGYQGRMNAVLRAYMLALRARVIAQGAEKDWRGDDI